MRHFSKHIMALCLTLFFVLCLAGSAQAYEIQRNLAWGVRGEDVSQLQSILNNLGFDSGKVDGIFGPITDGAVKRLQSAYSLNPDGIVGPKTARVISLRLNQPIAAPAPSVYKQELLMSATAYDDCWQCNGSWTGQPSYIGLPLQTGVVAVDPNVIPLGTKLWIEGYGEAVAADVGGAIKGNRIDLFYPDHTSASNYGIQKIKVYVL